MDNTSTAPGSFQVSILLCDGFALMSYASFVEPLRAANLLAGTEVCRIRHLSETGAPVQSSGAARVPVDASIGGQLRADLLVVVAGGDPFSFVSARTFGWLRRLAATGMTLGGVSGGPVVLAQAGVMKDRRMTVHWEHAAALAEAVPGLLLERSLYVIDRDRVTCGGGTAPMDMMHDLIAGRFGAGFARSVSDWFLHTDVRPSAGPQRAGLVERVGTTSRPVLDAVALMESHLADPLSLDQLAALAGVSGRQLSRLFRQHLGVTVMARYRHLRLEKARQLLRQSALSMTEIALATGFAGSSHFSSAFHEAYGEPPGRLRR
ncbi:MAG: GlxA family transcriptional regulator [Paracoccaceae bacterium]|nr:GlxA family transcriptional regulator [Paracoccaceae bacterium]